MEADFLERVKKLRASCQKLCIYGAGLYGQNLYKILKKRTVDVDGFLITKKTNETSLFGLPVEEFGAIQHADTGIVAGINRYNMVGVRKVLESSGFNLENVLWGHEFLDAQGVRAFDETPTVEITTRIGCSVDCRFCPQNTLLEKYFETDKKRDRVMSLETFSKCLNKLPDNCTILFSGMAEPFLNPACLEMMKSAVLAGHKVDLYTTLAGADSSVIAELCGIPLGFVTLHVADRYGYAHIPVSEAYYENLERLINLKKKDGTPFVNMCCAQTEPDQRVQEICKGKYEILTTMHDRAGNLNDTRLFKRECLSGPISCSVCGQKLNHNVLLPDGTLLLCCMDYGMKHKLGNLLEESYEKIMSGSEIQTLKRGLSGDGSIDILCRHCSCANPLFE